jgi:hypothetical protein
LLPRRKLLLESHPSAKLPKPAAATRPTPPSKKAAPHIPGPTHVLGEATHFSARESTHKAFVIVYARTPRKAFVSRYVLVEVPNADYKAG